MLLHDYSSLKKLSLPWELMSWMMKVLILFVQGDNPNMYGKNYATIAFDVCKQPYALYKMMSLE